MENKDLAKQFANIVMELQSRQDDRSVNNLFDWTIWTLLKWYDTEETEEAIYWDTYDWLWGNADYMIDKE